MNELAKSLIFVVVAVGLSGGAWWTTRDRSLRSAQFNDQGEAFFPEFKDPLACTDLEVVNFDASTATSTRFQVKFKDKRWVIPSHYDYPADARDRLSKTAAAVMDLAKDTIRSDRAEEQEEMGVIDPLDTKTTTLKGRGKRVTLRDGSENVLADFIIGNDIKGTERRDGSAQHYVRVPGQKRTYGVNVKADLSTRFPDWIETNLLKVDSGRIRRVVFDNYRIQEDRAPDGRPVTVLARGDKLTVERKDSVGPWSNVVIEHMDDKGKLTTTGIPPGQELNESKMRGLIDALADLKISGVRPKPPGLKNPNDPDLKLTIPIMLSLQSKGFIHVQGRGLYSDQGDVLVSTDEGVVYTLRYGGPVFASGEELTAGKPDEAEKKEEGKKKEAEKKMEGTQEYRFLMVTVSFDPTLIPQPKPEEKPETQPAAPGMIPDNPFAPDPAEQKAAEEKAARDKADYEKKIADGKKRVQELADRFAPWYYVTPGESFRAINLDAAALTQPKTPENNPNPVLPPMR
jgi:hypothetical protein